MTRMWGMGCAVIVAAVACAEAASEEEGTGAGATSNGGGGSGAAGGAGGAAGQAVGGDGGAEGGQGGDGGAARCTGQVDAAACYACCAGLFPQGEQFLELAFGGCGCHPSTCYPECTPWVCGNDGAPDNACASCIEQETATNGGCGMDEDFQAECLDIAVCADLIGCLSDCTI